MAGGFEEFHAWLQCCFEEDQIQQHTGVNSQQGSEQPGCAAAAWPEQTGPDFERKRAFFPPLMIFNEPTDHFHCDCLCPAGVGNLYSDNHQDSLTCFLIPSDCVHVAALSLGAVCCLFAVILIQSFHHPDRKQKPHFVPKVIYKVIYKCNMDKSLFIAGVLDIREDIASQTVVFLVLRFLSCFSRRINIFLRQARKPAVLVIVGNKGKPKQITQPRRSS